MIDVLDRFKASLYGLTRGSHIPRIMRLDRLLTSSVFVLRARNSQRKQKSKAAQILEVTVACLAD
jgi:hypothetical protein